MADSSRESHPYQENTMNLLAGLLLKRASNEHGQGSLEMALLTPVVLVLIVAVLELGFMVYAYINIVWAAKEGARAGAIYQYQQDCDKTNNDINRESGTGSCVKLFSDNIRDTIARSTSLLKGFDKVNNVTITYTQMSTNTLDTRSGDLVHVEIAYPYHFLTSLLTSRTITIRARATARIEP